MDELTKIIYEELLKKYNKQAINKKELAVELGISVSSINQFLKKGINLPEYKKNEVVKVGSKNSDKDDSGRISFPLFGVAKHLTKTFKSL